MSSESGREKIERQAYKSEQEWAEEAGLSWNEFFRWQATRELPERFQQQIKTTFSEQTAKLREPREKKENWSPLTEWLWQHDFEAAKEETFTRLTRAHELLQVDFASGKSLEHIVEIKSLLEIYRQSRSKQSINQRFINEINPKVQEIIRLNLPKIRELLEDSSLTADKKNQLITIIYRMDCLIDGIYSPTTALLNELIRRNDVPTIQKILETNDGSERWMIYELQKQLELDLGGDSLADAGLLENHLKNFALPIADSASRTVVVKLQDTANAYKYLQVLSKELTQNKKLVKKLQQEKFDFHMLAERAFEPWTKNIDQINGLQISHMDMVPYLESIVTLYKLVPDSERTAPVNIVDLLKRIYKEKHLDTFVWTAGVKEKLEEMVRIFNLDYNAIKS